MKKKIFYILLTAVLILAALGWWCWKYVYPDYQIWKLQQSVLNLEKEINNYLAGDTYGGKTPEETYSLYIAALEKGDTDSASKYFYWEKQAKQKEKLDELKAKNELAKYISDLPKWGKLKREEYGDENTSQYSYEFIQKEDKVYFDEILGKEDILKAGTYKSIIDFQFNIKAKIWKIYSL